MTVEELLQQSREAHQRYRDAVPHRVPSGSFTVVVAGDPGEAKTALQEAYDARLQAEALDASLVADLDHQALLTFYREQLSR